MPLKDHNFTSVLICADCSAPDPRWASLNRCVFICDECCSVHRSLGRHVSNIKSVDKDKWYPSLLTLLKDVVSHNSNKIWEHALGDNPLINNNKPGWKRKPNPRDLLRPAKEEFIRAKYQLNMYTIRPLFSSHQQHPVSTVDGLNDSSALERNSCDDTTVDLSKQLHSCVRTNNHETCLRLISLGANPNFYHPDKGNTPIHIAAQAGQASQVELLVLWGADPSAPDLLDGRTAADYARSEGFVDLAERLISLQYEVTDRLAEFVCGRIPDHQSGHHFIVPEIADTPSAIPEIAEMAKSAKKSLRKLNNFSLERLIQDVYDEVERRQTEHIWGSAASGTMKERQGLPFLPINHAFTSERNQGRQKLARFNRREFSTLVIDLLAEARRRELCGSMATSFHVDDSRAIVELANQTPSKNKNARESGVNDSSENSPSSHGDTADDLSLGDITKYDNVLSSDDDRRVFHNPSSPPNSPPSSIINDDNKKTSPKGDDDDAGVFGSSRLSTRRSKRPSAQVINEEYKVSSIDDGANNRDVSSQENGKIELPADTLDKDVVTEQNGAIFAKSITKVQKTLSIAQDQINTLTQANHFLNQEVTSLKSMIVDLTRQLCQVGVISSGPPLDFTSDDFVKHNRDYDNPPTVTENKSRQKEKRSKLLPNKNRGKSNVDNSLPVSLGNQSVTISQRSEYDNEPINSIPDSSMMSTSSTLTGESNASSNSVNRKKSVEEVKEEVVILTNEMTRHIRQLMAVAEKNESNKFTEISDNIERVISAIVSLASSRVKETTEIATAVTTTPPSILPPAGLSASAMELLMAAETLMDAGHKLQEACILASETQSQNDSRASISSGSSSMIDCAFETAKAAKALVTGVNKL